VFSKIVLRKNALGVGTILPQEILRRLSLTNNGKNGFVAATKLGTTNKFFVAATKTFAAATKRLVDRTKSFAVVTKCFYHCFNK